MYIIMRSLPQLSQQFQDIFLSFTSVIAHSNSISCILPTLQNNPRLTEFLYSLAQWIIELLIILFLNKYILKSRIYPISLLLTLINFSFSDLITKLCYFFLGHKIDDTYYVYGDYQIKWNSSQYFEINFPIGLTIFLFYLIVVPTLNITIIKNFNNLPNNKIQSTKYDKLYPKFTLSKLNFPVPSENRQISINISEEEEEEEEEEQKEEEYDELIQDSSSRNSNVVSWKSVNERIYWQKYGNFLSDRQFKYFNLVKYVFQLIIIAISCISNDFLKSVLYIALILGNIVIFQKNPPFQRKKYNTLYFMSNLILILNLLLILIYQYNISLESDQEQLLIGNSDTVILFIDITLLAINFIFTCVLISYLLPNLKTYNSYINYYSQKYKCLRCLKICVSKKNILLGRKTRLNWQILRYNYKNLLKK